MATEGSSRQSLHVSSCLPANADTFAPQLQFSLLPAQEQWESDSISSKTQEEAEAHCGIFPYPVSLDKAEAAMLLAREAIEGTGKRK